jgi:nitroreductase
MDLMDAIFHRRATRDFTQAPVDDEAIRFVIAAAIQAPNAMNRQPWSFAVVTDPEILDRCARRAKAHVLASLSPGSPLAHYRAHLAAREFHIFYNAPALIVISATAPDPMATQDCCLAAENLMLAAHASGLGTCWIGFAEPWLRQPEGRNELGLPSHHLPVAPIIIGHPRITPPAQPRRDPDIRWINA